MGRKITILLLLTVIIFSGCQQKPKPVKPLQPQYDRPLPPGAHALRKITNPYEIPDFSLACLNTTGLRESIDNSLNYLGKPSSKKYFPIQGISHRRVVKSLEAFGDLLDSGLRGPALNQAIREKFDVYISIGCDDRGTVLFTGYYTPIFDGADSAGGPYQYPLYKTPPDLIKGPDGQIIGKRMPDGGIFDYPPRSQIEQSNMLRGQELLWLTDPFEAYIAHVQGSAKIRKPDGNLETIGYAASNGHDYRGISKQMIADKVISKEQLSLAAMIQFFKNNKHLVKKYTQLNPRYIFFRKSGGDVHGSLNEPVIDYRSIATDKSIFPRAAMTFIATKLPVERNGVITAQVYSGFALDQDTGGAIRAPGRCDVYMGTGDKAGELAGATYQEGKLYYLFLKDPLIISEY